MTDIKHEGGRGGGGGGNVRITVTAPSPKKAVASVMAALNPTEAATDIAKIDEEARTVFGFASVATIEDKQGDTIAPAVLERAAYDFVKNARAANVMHEGPIVGECIESLFITAEKAALLGIPEEHVGKWWTGYHIPDDQAWENVKNGTTRAFSIEGRGKRVQV